VPEEFWTMEAELATGSVKATHFRAQLVSFTDGTKLNVNNQQKIRRPEKQAARRQIRRPFG